MVNDKRKRDLQKKRARQQRRAASDLPPLPPADPKKDWTWAQCDDCNRPFAAPGGFAWNSSQTDMIITQPKVGYCPNCGGWGTIQNVFTQEHGEVKVSGSTEAGVAGFLRLIISELSAGEMEVADAVTELERFGGVLASVAVWLREHFSIGQLARDLLVSVLTTLLIQWVSGGGLTAEDVERIMDEKLQQHEHEAPTVPEDRPGAPEKPARDEQQGERDSGDVPERGAEHDPEEKPRREQP